jgi:hypothetical protein
MIKLYFEIRREMGCTPAVAWAIAMDMVANDRPRT